MTLVKRGDVWLINLDPAIGHEIKKARPGVVIQNDVGNKYSQITIVAPLTSQNTDKAYPFEAIITKKTPGLPKDSKALLNQIRAIDKSRMIKKLANLGKQEMEQVDEAIKISLGLKKI